MNPVFASKLAIDNNGQVYLAAGNTMVPGALPRTPNPLATTAVTPQAPQTSQPVEMASVPQPAPQPKKSEAPHQKPTSIAGLFGNLFSGLQAQAKPSAPAPESKSVALRGINTEMAAQPKRAAPAASAPTMPHPSRTKPRRPSLTRWRTMRRPRRRPCSKSATIKRRPRLRRTCAPPIRRSRRATAVC